MSDANDHSPIFSTLSHLSERRAGLDAFLFKLGEMLDMLQEAERDLDFEEGARLAHDLASEAPLFGYAPLASAARAVEHSCAALNSKTLREKIETLTSVIHRIRAGHRVLP